MTDERCLPPRDSARARAPVLATLPALAVLVGAGLPALAGCRALHGRAPPFAREIEAENRRLEQLFREGDLLGIADVYADDALLFGSGGMRIEGRTEIDEYWSDVAQPLEWRLEIEELGGSEQLAWELGTSRLTVRVDGQPRTSAADFLVLWRRDSTGAWRILSHVWWERER